MAFNIPSLSAHCERTRNAFRSNLPGTDAWLPFNNVYVTAKVVAGAIYEVFGFADYIAQQKFALTADREHLLLHGQEYGLAPKPAGPAEHMLAVVADEACTVDAGALFQRSDGLQYRALATVASLGAATLDAHVVAVGDGAATTSIAGTSLDIVSGVTGAVSSVTVASSVALGADDEPMGPKFSTDLSTFRGRILFRKRNPSHGGSPADYVDWCGQVPGVTRTFIERRWSGAGTVRVFPLMDDLFANGIADASAIGRVRDFIETVAPATADVTVAAPEAVAVDVTITGLSPDTTAVREAVMAELRATFRRVSRVAGIDADIAAMPYLAHPTTFSRSWLWQAIANASGEERHIVASPAADVSLSAGQIAILGAVTFA